MRAHNPASKKLPPAWKKLSAPWAACSEQARVAPRCSVPPGKLGFPELITEYFGRVFFLRIKTFSCSLLSSHKSWRSRVFKQRVLTEDSGRVSQYVIITGG